MTTHHADEPIDAPYDPHVARRLLAYLRPYGGHVAGALVLLLALAGIAALQPYLVKIAIDDHISTGDLRGLAGIAGLYLALLVVELGLGAARAYLTSWIGQRAMHDLRSRLFRQLQRLPVSFFDRNPIGRMVTRVTTDVEVLNDLFSSGVVAVLSDLFMLTAIAMTMAWLDWRLTMVTLIVLPLVLAASLYFRRRMRTAYRDIRRRVAALSAFLQERVTGQVVVQLFGRERDSAEAFAELNRLHRDAHLRSIRYEALFYPLIELLSSLAVALLIWYGGGEILRGALTFGALVAFLQYAHKFFRPIRDLAEKYNLLQAAMASGERLFALLDEPAAPGVEALRTSSGRAFDTRPVGGGAIAAQPTADSRQEGSIVFEDVWFAYEPGVWVLRGVSFTVPAGRRLALVGATGAGKTTIANLLCRFYEVDRGSILVDGVDIRDMPLATLRRRLGLVLQDGFLFSGTVRDNVRLHDPHIPDARVDAALSAIGADRFVAALPDGADSPLGERGRVLSTGQKQLVAFARALAFDPPVLILDEATSSIDSASEAAIERAIGRLLADRTSIVIAHRLSTIRRVDEILVLHHGAVHESGSHETLLAANGLYARLYQLQYADQAGSAATTGAS